MLEELQCHNYPPTTTPPERVYHVNFVDLRLQTACLGARRTNPPSWQTIGEHTSIAPLAFNIC